MNKCKCKLLYLSYHNTECAQPESIWTSVSTATHATMTYGPALTFARIKVG